MYIYRYFTKNEFSHEHYTFEELRELISKPTNTPEEKKLYKNEYIKKWKEHLRNQK